MNWESRLQNSWEICHHEWDLEVNIPKCLQCLNKEWTLYKKGTRCSKRWGRLAYIKQNFEGWRLQ